MAVATVCDPDGNLLFTEADVPAWRQELESPRSHLRGGRQAQRDLEGRRRGTPLKILSRPLRRFLFKLALALGKDVREIEAWPSPLISEWLAYDQLDPIPDPNWLAGMQAATMVNLWSKSRSKPDDFIPRVPLGPTAIDRGTPGPLPRDRGRPERPGPVPPAELARWRRSAG